MKTLNIVAINDKKNILEDKLISDGGAYFLRLDNIPDRDGVFIIICNNNINNINAMYEFCKKRWNIELDIRVLKKNLQFGNLEYVLAVYQGQDIFDEYYNPDNMTEIEKILMKISNYQTFL